MTDYRFSVIVSTSSMTDDEILKVCDALGAAVCTDASVRGHALGMELLFDRESDSLEEAIQSAVTDVERAGFRVAKVEMEREAVAT